MKTKEISAVVAMIVVLVSIYYFSVILPEKELEKNHRFTVGKISRLFYPSEGGRCADFYYNYKHKKYKGTFTVGEEDKYMIGSLIFLKFSPKDPENCIVQLEVDVPNNFPIPENGWKRIPTYK